MDESYPPLFFNFTLTSDSNFMSLNVDVYVEFSSLDCGVLLLSVSEATGDSVRLSLPYRTSIEGMTVPAVFSQSSSSEPFDSLLSVSR